MKIKKDKHARYWLDLGKVGYAAETTVNGVAVGKRCFTPFVFDITSQIKKGDNVINVKVTPSMYNEFVKRGIDGQRLFKMLKTSTLAAQGIMGPVRILKSVNGKEKK